MPRRRASRGNWCCSTTRSTLDVPLDDLAVHEPDARKLIAFLKAMEFTTLTRRVAEYSQIDPSDVEADAATRAAPASSRRRRPARRRQGYAEGATCSMLPVASPPPRQATAGQGADKQDKAASPKGTPISLAAARAEAARKLPVDRSKYETIRTLDRTEGLDRAHPRHRHVRDRRQGNVRSIRCRPTSAASRWRSAPNDACYIPLAHKQSGDGAGLFDAGLAPDQIKACDALDALKPLLESAGILKIGFNIKFNARDAGAARHHACATSTTCS